MAPQLGKQLSDLFGTEDIGDKVKNYDFAKKLPNEPLLLELTPTYGKLNKDTVKRLKTEQKVVTIGVVKRLAKLPTSPRWFHDSVLQMRMIVDVRAEDGNSVPITRVDRFVKDSSKDFKTDGSPSSPIVQEVYNWFAAFIGDQDMLDAIKIDKVNLGKIMAHVGSMIPNLEASVAKDEYLEKPLFDLTILRFPDSSNWNFRVYRIALKAWFDARSNFSPAPNKPGITGEHWEKTFKSNLDIRRDGLETFRLGEEAEKLFV